MAQRPRGDRGHVGHGPSPGRGTDGAQPVCADRHRPRIRHQRPCGVACGPSDGQLQGSPIPGPIHRRRHSRVGTPPVCFLDHGRQCAPKSVRRKFRCVGICGSTRSADGPVRGPFLPRLAGLLRPDQPPSRRGASVHGRRTLNIDHRQRDLRAAALARLQRCGPSVPVYRIIRVANSRWCVDRSSTTRS